MKSIDFIDNLDGNTLAVALTELLRVSTPEDKVSEPPEEVCIATAYFSPTGFAHIADALRPIPGIRLMLGVDLGAPQESRALGETDAMFEKRRLHAGLARLDGTLRWERDRLPFTPANGAALRKLIGALRAGNMEVRRYEKSFLHAKAYIFSPANRGNSQQPGLIAGSSNLTGAGLTRNLELNIARFDEPIGHRAQLWFDKLWEEADPYELAIVFEELFLPRTPREIFVRVLWQLYGDEVTEDANADGDLPLTSFQKHGVARALRLIRDTGGAIVADEVGLGKTFIAGEVLDIYRKRRQRALLVCPAALRDTTWKEFLTRFQLFAECVSFEELASEKQLRDARRPKAKQVKLQRKLDEYQLIVVDEAHNYRNPDAPTRAAALRRLLFGQRRDVLLLTATPVNNSLWDLYHLVRFFVRQDGHFADRGIISIRGRFEQAMREDPSDLSPDVLYPIIDATTVKRTRQFVRKHYRHDRIKGPDGKQVEIEFPEPNAISVRYDLEHVLPGFFDRLEKALDPDGPDAIRFVRYMPDIYLVEGGDSEEDARARAMVGLLRSGLLKRFESSAFAFEKTVQKMAREHDVFLEALDTGRVVTTAFMRELSADDDAVFKDLLAGTENKEDATLYDVESLRAGVARDRDLLKKLAEEAARITPDRAPKLKALADELAKIAQQASEEATSAIDEVQKRKVLVFSYFEDTVVWIRDFLEKELERRLELACYRNRIAAVSGSDDLEEESRIRVVQGFAPVSMEAPVRRDADKYDLLISTDVLAEGVNLQQCRHIINFDLPWNPMRLVQRHGRIDRIGSPHNRVFLRTIFPVDRLNRLLNLEQRILNKLAMAAASVGVAPPIEGAAQGTQVFTETRDEIEKLLKEDASLYERGATVGAAQTGEEYRQTLRKALAGNEKNIAKMPWKTGSGMARGKRRGLFFCAEVGEEPNKNARTYLRFVAANEDWSVSRAEDAVVRELGTCLRLIECEPESDTWFPNKLQECVYEFWDVAQEDILEDWTYETDPANYQPKVRPLNLRVAGFIRDNMPLDIEEERVRTALDILESPWPRREEIMLRGWFQDVSREGSNLSRFLIQQIIDTGLEPVEPREPLPPITRQDIHLLCWMGIEAKSTRCD